MDKKGNLPIRSAKGKQFAGKVDYVDPTTGAYLGSALKYRSQLVKTIFITMYLNDELMYEFMSGLGNPGKVIAYILKDYNDKTGMFYFTSTAKDYMVKELGLSIGTIRSCVRELALKRTILHIGGAEYMINPKLFYKGPQANYEMMVESFNGFLRIAEMKQTQANLDAKTVIIDSE